MSHGAAEPQRHGRMCAVPLTEPVTAPGTRVPPHRRRWPASLAVVVVFALQLGSPRAAVPRWWPLILTVELLLLLPLVIMNPIRLTRDHPKARLTAVALTALLLVANTIWVVQLVLVLVNEEPMPPGRLMTAAGLIWITNVVASAIAYWELDRGGPFARDPEHPRQETAPDLLFAQMQDVPGWDARTWRPAFLDYVFVAFTSATAFSPTDTLPLSARAKVLMMLNAAVSLATIAIVAARAVNSL